MSALQDHIDDEEESEDRKEPGINNEQRTLLPSPIASIVSLITSTSSFSVKTAGFIANTALAGAKLGALSSFELSRIILEGVLYRAGQDVVSSSSGSLGRAAAESVLERSLLTLHSSITSTSFLISTGFQIAQTSTSAGLAISRHFLTAIDAVLGDTETSKAIATIIVMVQREIKSPQSTDSSERLTLTDVITGVTGFAVLQKWVATQSEQELHEDGKEKLVWSIVVTNEESPVERTIEEDRPLSVMLPNDDNNEGYSGSLSASRARPFFSEPDSATPLDQGLTRDDMSVASFSSENVDTRPDMSRPERAFREQLMRQLKPGSSVKVTAQSITMNTVTVEVDGDSSSHVEPPSGYSIIAAHNDDFQGANGQRLIFRNQSRRARHGSFIVEDSSPMNETGNELQHLQDETKTLEPHTMAEGESRDASEPPQKRPSTPSEAVRANQKRPRSSRKPNHRRSVGGHSNQEAYRSDSASHVVDDGQDNNSKTWLRKTLNNSSSYRQLVHFWNNGQSPVKKRSRDPMANLPHLDMSAIPGMEPDHSSSPEVVQRQHYTPTQQRSSVDQNGLFGISRSRPSRSFHRKGRSSVSSMASMMSETSMVLHVEPTDSNNLSTHLNTRGILPSQWPKDLFARNVARFARFAIASYGSRFLKFMGAYAPEAPLHAHTADLEEHRDFMKYTRLPPSAVLVSSYVDPQGGSDASGQTGTGLPLIHYISLDHDSKSVVVTLRGTLGFEDILTDMTCDYDNFSWRGRTYQVHKGMLASARRLLTLHGGRMIKTAKEALEEFQDYGLVVCGHSLGGAVAAIIGMMVSQPHNGPEAGFTTISIGSPTNLAGGMTSAHPADAIALTLPPFRPIHVYAYGPAACLSPPLQLATRGLVTTIVHDQDIVPRLSLGVLHDFQAIALEFKTDTRDAKGEVKKRVWNALSQSVRDRTGLSAFNGVFSSEWLPLKGRTIDKEEEDHWPWAAMKSLRSGMTATKLVPPGEVFLVQSRPVLQKHAFVKQPDPGATVSSKPATHVRVTHVKDVNARFGEVKFGAGMFAHHSPASYETILGILERGVAV